MGFSQFQLHGDEKVIIRWHVRLRRSGMKVCIAQTEHPLINKLGD